MTLDGFLTFLALIVAIIALMPPVRRLHARFALGPQLLIGGGALAFVLYLEFFDVLGRQCPQSLGGLCRVLVFEEGSAFSPADAAFVVVMIWLVTASSIYFFAKPGAAALPALSRMLDDLAHEGRFAELIQLARPFFSLISRASTRQLTLQRIHHTLRRWNGDDWEAALDRQDPNGFQRLLGRLAPLTPSMRKSEETASDIARLLLNSAPLRAFIVRERPGVAVELMAIKAYVVEEFTERVLADFIATPGSLLYQELEQNQNYAQDGGYRYPESNRLLHYLFADTKVAETHSAWKPVGDFVLSNLRADTNPQYVNALNRSPGDFDTDRWRDPTACGLFYFDLMVRAAAVQGVGYCMWLQYLGYIVDSLVDNYDMSQPGVDPDDEFPTVSARLIYECVDMLGAWIEIISKTPEGSRHRVVPANVESDGGSIPVTAALTLAHCIGKIARSDKLGVRFASYMHECIMTDLKGLSKTGVEGEIRAYLIRAIVREGRDGQDAEFGKRLQTLYDRADHILWSDVSDYGAALQAAYPSRHFR